MSSIELNPNAKRLPFGGHHFVDHGQAFKGESFDEVETKLRDYRINNLIPVGDPKKEILEMYATHYPWMVRPVEDPEPEEGLSRNYEFWRAWVTKLWKNPQIKFISAKEASMRWNICENCRFNKTKSWAKSEEAQELERRLFLLRKGQDIPKFLGYCACHRADIGIMSFSEAPAKLSEKKKDLTQPADCWV